MVWRPRTAANSSVDSPHYQRCGPRKSISPAANASGLSSAIQCPAPAIGRILASPLTSSIVPRTSGAVGLVAPTATSTGILSFPFRGDQIAIVLRVLVEGPIELECRAHGTRCSLGGQISLKVGFRDRFRIRHAEAEEPLQIMPFAPRHQRFRQIPDVVERKLLIARAGAQLIEHRGSRQWRIDRDQVRDDVAPSAPGLRKAMQQDNRPGAAAGGDIMDADAGLWP